MQGGKKENNFIRDTLNLNSKYNYQISNSHAESGSVACRASDS